MSSARTQPGVPTGRRVLAREASWRAVLMSPRLKAACADGEIGVGEIAFAAIGHGELGIGVRRLGLARHRGAQHFGRFLGVPALLLVPTSACAKQDLDQRRVIRELHGLAQRRDRLGRLAAFQQRLALELVEIGIVRLRLDQLVDLDERAAQSPCR